MQISLICADDDIWASGMRIISSVLRKAGHKTTMIFAGSPGVPIDRPVAQRIAELVGDSEIIGISSMSRGAQRAKELIEVLRPLGKLIIWGGMHPTLFPEDCVAHVDLVCRGEGEEFMLDLVDRVASGKGYADIPNGAYLSNGRPVLNDLRPPIADLDLLPLLDYAFDKEYIINQNGTFIPNTNMREGAYNILFSGSRGCLNQCSYCSNSQLLSLYKGNGRFVRKMSISRFVDAANEYHKLFPRANWFYFTDEDFFARPVEEMREFSEVYSNQLRIPWECMASPRQITEEKVDLAVKAGMRQIDIGLETGSERIRFEIFNRHISNEMQMKATMAINKHPQVQALYFLIIGNPYEERTDLLEGIQFIEKMPTPFSLRTYNLVFIPGTKLFNRACHDGVIKGINDSASNLDFLGGYNYKTHQWKRNNIYLNCLLSLMSGDSTRWRVGLIPRGLIPVLRAPKLVNLCDRHELIGITIAELTHIIYRMKRIVTFIPPASKQKVIAET